MKKSIITQKIIAKSFKELMVTEDFNHISVSDIMQKAAIRRQTFYNYFEDKEELLSWIFENEFSELVSDNFDYYDWKSELLLLTRYLDDNQIFYQKSFLLDPSFEKFFLKQCEILLDKIISDHEKKSDTVWSDFDKDFLSQYNANALCQIFKEAILRSRPLEKIVPNLIRLIAAQLDEL